MLSYNVGPAVPASVKSLGDYMQWCKANPDKASFGTTSPAARRFCWRHAVERSEGAAQSSALRGGAPALQDVVGGHIAASVNPTSESMPLYQAGTIRILAVTGAKRSEFLPDVPTMAEQGFKS